MDPDSSWLVQRIHEWDRQFDGRRERMDRIRAERAAMQFEKSDDQ